MAAGGLRGGEGVLALAEQGFHQAGTEGRVRDRLDAQRALRLGTVGWLTDSPLDSPALEEVLG